MIHRSIKTQRVYNFLKLHPYYKELPLERQYNTIGLSADSLIDGGRLVKHLIDYNQITPNTHFINIDKPSTISIIST